MLEELACEYEAYEMGGLCPVRFGDSAITLDELKKLSPLDLLNKEVYLLGHPLEICLLENTEHPEFSQLRVRLHESSMNEYFYMGEWSAYEILEEYVSKVFGIPDDAYDD